MVFWEPLRSLLSILFVDLLYRFHFLHILSTVETWFLEILFLEWPGYLQPAVWSRLNPYTCALTVSSIPETSIAGCLEVIFQSCYFDCIPQSSLVQSVFVGISEENLLHIDSIWYGKSSPMSDWLPALENLATGTLFWRLTPHIWPLKSGLVVAVACCYSKFIAAIWILSSNLIIYEHLLIWTFTCCVAFLRSDQFCSRNFNQIESHEDE